MPLGAFRLNTLSAAVSTAVAPPRATGGTITYPVISGQTYKVHEFTTNGSFVVTSAGSVDAIIVGGGGSGGRNAFDANYASGGGGGGQVKYQTGVAVTAQTYSITIGLGGVIGSNTTGVSGGSTTALGYTSNGGGFGGGRTDGTSVTGGQGGGGGAYSNTAYNGGTGTYNGGNGRFAGGLPSAGGGGGAAENGVTAVSTTGGRGGNGYNLINIMTTSNTYVAAGGGGGGSATSATGNGGVAGNSTGTGINATTYGSGGGGSYAAGAAAKGGNGADGAVYIRYPITPVSSMSLITSKTQASSASANFVIPTGGDTPPDYFNVAAGDIAILFDSSTTTTDTIPSGWTSIDGSTTTGIRTNISYKILTSGDLGATIVGMGGVNRKVMLVYRANSSINTVNATVTGSQATTVVPTNQSLVGEAGPMIAFAVYASTGAVGTRGWSAGSPTEYSIAVTSSIYVKALITNSGTPTTSTISMTDGGTNTLQSFRLKFI